LTYKKYKKTLEDFESKNWKEKVIHTCLHSVILLVRKDNKKKDIESALQAVNALQEAQSEFESQYIDTVEDIKKNRCCLCSSWVLSHCENNHGISSISSSGIYLPREYPKSRKNAFLSR
jgi:Zn-dependent M16 (insulinase) family peptidase